MKINDMYNLVQTIDHDIDYDELNEIDNDKDKLTEYFKNVNKDFSEEELDFVVSYYSSTDKRQFFMDYFDKQPDADKAKVVLGLNESRGYKRDVFLSKIKNSFYRHLVVLQTSEYQYETDDLIEAVDDFENIKSECDKLETEEEKAEYISSLEFNNMKLELLSNIKGKENRELIIQSLKNEINPEIQPQVELVQTMIREYFEDTLKDNFDDKKRERMEIIFNKADVNFKDYLGTAGTNGNANWLFDEISILSRYKNNNNQLLGFLVHEYEHLLSRHDHKTTANITSQVMEEGMADVFADLVINHYIEKHKDVELDGKRIRIDYPFQAHSSYEVENAWQRTALYGLSKSGKDIDAIGEYVLGDKNKYLELIIGKEAAQKKTLNQFGIPDLKISLDELYENPESDFNRNR